MTPEGWDDGRRTVGLALYAPATVSAPDDRTAIWINGGGEAATGWLPEPRPGHAWRLEMDASRPEDPAEAGPQFALPPRSVLVFAEVGVSSPGSRSGR